MNTPVRVIWLASYPKSGNTWVRFMLLNLLLGKQESTENMAKFIPDIHRCPGYVHFHPGFPALVKTHFLLTDRLPLVHLSAAYIYVVRNPLDVLMSATNYFLLRKGMSPDAEASQSPRARYIQDFLAHGGDPEWIEGRLGSWDENVRSWVMDNQRVPGIVIRYEDLHRDPVQQLGRINDLLRLGASAQQLREAVDNASFDRMRKIENHERTQGVQGFFAAEAAANPASGARFMSRGRPGAGNELTPVERAQLISRFGPTMKLFGYET